jgi:O-antigen biosynthesis protein WbqP
MITSKRIFDVVVGLQLGILILFPLLLIALLVKIDSTGPAIYWSKRVGYKNKLFLMPKFRSMKVTAPVVATHLLDNPDQHLTKIGKFIRKFSLDELPQIWSILKGDMSFVGPRPALFNQDDLINMRINKGIDLLIPGLTGWAQINGRDVLSNIDKVQLDEEYLKRQSLLLDIQILVLTFNKVLSRENILH